MKTLVAVLCALFVLPAAAQSYPSKPLKIFNPYSAGGPAEGLARVIANKISPSLGQPIVIESRGGAGGAIATSTVAKSPNDGYTLLLAHMGPMAIVPAVQKDINYELKDFEPITQLVSGPTLLVVRNDLPIHSVAEFIAYAKANPGKLTYGSIGVGSSTHLAGEMMAMMAGIDMVHVPFKGSTQTLIEMMGGRISASFIGLSGVIEQVKAGQVRPLAVSTLRRSPSYPEFPAVSETLPGYEVNSWYGMMAPAGTPRPIIERLNREIVGALKSPEIAAWTKVNGFDAFGTTPEQFAAFVRAEQEKWARIVKAAKVQTN